MFEWLNEDSKKFLSKGYLSEGQNAEDRIWEIAVRAEEILDQVGFADKFYHYMGKGYYSLSSPIWSNFGNTRGLPISCNGVYVNDTISSILKKGSEVGAQTKYGAGTSGYFGDIRSRGLPISTGGSADGPVHFMEIFEKVTDVISQGNVRRGSFAAYLDIEHPDVDEFLEIREVGNSIQNMSLGLCISDKWMEEMIEEGNLVKTKQLEPAKAKKLNLWARVMRKRKESGYPYLFFTDTVNSNKPQVLKDKNVVVHASNLCISGKDRVVTSKGYLTARELYESGEELELFDGVSKVRASEMKLREKNVDTYKIVLENGLEHTATDYHKVKVKTGRDTFEMVELKNLKVGDAVVIQNNKGIFGTTHMPEEAYNLGKNAELPTWIWDSDEETCISFIQGVLEEDNNLNNDKEFLQQVQLLCINLGLFVYLKSEDNSFNLVVADELTDTAKVKAIEYVGKEDVFCPTVYSDEHVFVAQGIVTSNCSEIALPSSDDQSFVCNLASMNILHYDEWKETDAVAILTYFLDAVMSEYIDKTEHIPFMEASNNFAKYWRALGIGQLGWHSYLQSKMIAFESEEAMELAAEVSEAIDEQSLLASQEMALEYGEPEGLLGYGIRNLTRTAIAPTTSSSFILGQVSPSIEPLRSNYFVKDLAKGVFTYKNPYLEKVLESYGKNDKETWENILVNKGSVQHLDFLSQEEKDVFKTFEEIVPMTIVNQAAIRQQYIDQSQSLNLMIPANTPIKDINQLIIKGWQLGVKTFYYQRSSNPSQELVRDILSCSVCEA